MTTAGDTAGGSAPEAVLDGTVERFVFRDEDSHFTVARFTVPGQPMPVTILGELVGVTEGLPLRVRGIWVDDRKWGRQFKVATYQLRSPETLVGIEKFLGSGLIPGIGAELARRLVGHFGMDTLEVIDRQPHRLTEVACIGAESAARLAEAFAAQRHVQDVMVFLRGHGVSAAFAARIVKRYGKDAINIVRENPYRLAREIWGIGFRTADAIAEKLGIARDAPERLEVGLLHALEVAGEQGNMHLPDDELLAAAGELLSIARDPLLPRLGALVERGLVIREVLGDRGACSSLPIAWRAETETATMLAELVRTPARGTSLDLDAAVHDFEVATNVQLAPEQRRAVTAAVADKCVVITGGPGVGKTTIIRAVVHLAQLLRRRVLLAAPTGRAAKRLGEATSREATTIHRLLEFQPQSGGFARGRDNPLEVDVVVIDEASMVDAQLFCSLVAALPAGAQLVLVGDVDQLPSVGAGAVLVDVIASEVATVVRLTETYRQAAKTKNLGSAHRINPGALPELHTSPGDADFYFIARDDPEAARATIVELVAERIPARFGLDALTGVQVLAPMHRGDLGTAALNKALQARLTPSNGSEITRGDRVFRRGDKVMQLRNDYDRNVFNGDIGVIATIDSDASVVHVDFTGGDSLPAGSGAEGRRGVVDGRPVIYERAELDQLVHAYAVSVHKSQGSEYPAVVIPIVTQHYMMLQRSLLYTAVTRGKQLVVLVGSRRAVALAVRNADTRKRYTWLAERLRAAAVA